MRIHHLLVPVLAPLDVLAQPEPLAARRLALPSTAVVLIALVHAVAALGAGVRVPRDVAGDAADGRCGRALADLGRDGIPEDPRHRLHDAGHPHHRAEQPVVQHLAGIQDPLRIDLLLEGPEARQPLGAEHLAGLPGEVQARAVRAPAVRLRNPDHREGERVGEAEAPGSFVARNEAEDDHLGLAPGAPPNHDRFLHERLPDLAFDLVERPRQPIQRDDHLGRHQRRPEPLDRHQLEPVLPLVIGQVLRQPRRAARGQQLVHDRFHDAAHPCRGT